mmetsp:Transcript_40788/g.72370  ORF Transcript_40788/g.72370 Transcript_40788/m.72370 type:complete len:370 (-) Transcript_40788:271-1380(-)
MRLVPVYWRPGNTANSTTKSSSTNPQHSQTCTTPTLRQADAENHNSNYQRSTKIRHARRVAPISRTAERSKSKIASAASGRHVGGHSAVRHSLRSLQELPGMPKVVQLNLCHGGLQAPGDSHSDLVGNVQQCLNDSRTVLLLSELDDLLLACQQRIRQTLNVCSVAVCQRLLNDAACAAVPCFLICRDGAVLNCSCDCLAVLWIAAVKKLLDDMHAILCAAKVSQLACDLVEHGHHIPVPRAAAMVLHKAHNHTAAEAILGNLHYLAQQLLGYECNELCGHHLQGTRDNVVGMFGLDSLKDGASHDCKQSPRIIPLARCIAIGSNNFQRVLQGFAAGGVVESVPQHAAAVPCERKFKNLVRFGFIRVRR